MYIDCDKPARLCAYLHGYLGNHVSRLFIKISAHDTYVYGRGSVLFWRRCVALGRERSVLPMIALLDSLSQSLYSTQLAAH